MVQLVFFQIDKKNTHNLYSNIVYFVFIIGITVISTKFAFWVIGSHLLQNEEVMALEKEKSMANAQLLVRKR